MIASKQAREALVFARAQLGKPYVFGATGPDSYDCSGLTQTSYARVGVSIPRTSEAQWQADYPRIEWGKWLDGDLIYADFHDGQASPGHVVMYAGNGNVIQAPHTGTDVQVTPVDVFKEAYVGSNRPTAAVHRLHRRHHKVKEVVTTRNRVVVGYVHSTRVLWLIRHHRVARRHRHLYFDPPEGA